MHPEPHKPVRARFELHGRVQGVGFRPYVYRLAREFGLAGFVSNDTAGAVIEVEGADGTVDAFADALRRRVPPLARIRGLRRSAATPCGESEFRIDRSDATGPIRVEVAPDAATCSDCVAELLDPRDRRSRYALINCTNCGPRYSIIRSSPYDRPATTMAEFAMCGACAAEYAAPADRRFHAQPTACPACGPRLRLTDGQGRELPGDPIARTADLLREGCIVAIKGLGGYHLACDATNDAAVARLRRKKIRDGKPLAVLVADLAAAERIATLEDAERAALIGPEAPIVLVRRRPGHGIADGVAPGCAEFGLLLPYTPVHHLLMRTGLAPLVLTSGNAAGLPLTYRDTDARRVLGSVADAFLWHEREIFRPIDDSVVFVFRGEATPIRRARGYVPQGLSVAVGGAVPSILAVGGELKSAVCLLQDERAILSEHLGDLTRPETYRHFVEAIERLKQLFAFRPRVVAHDLHPAYLATRYALHSGLRAVGVQHHHAHIAGVMAEHAEAGPVLGLACDGSGYGPDGAVWGCELLRCERGDYARLGHLEYFPLIGGDAAAVEPRRPAVALLHAALGPSWRQAVADARPELMERIEAAPQRGADAAPASVEALEALLRGRLNSPPTSSLGRVFDASAFLLGLCERNRYEGEAAMRLEAAAADEPDDLAPLGFELGESADALHLGIRPLVRDVLGALAQGEPVGRISARIHETLARLLCAAARAAAARSGIRVVALSGGCFVNRRLLRRVVALLEESGLRVLSHRYAPPGDGGLALGQAWVAAWTARSNGRL